MIDKTDNIYYKLTDHESYTRREEPGETLWTPGVEHVARGEGVELCTSAVIHAYRHPLLAAFLNPIHIVLKSPLLWEALGGPVVADDGLQIGVKRLTAMCKLTVPVFTIEQLTTAAIRIALELTGWWCGKKSFAAWAAGWISGKDRSAARAADVASVTAYLSAAEIYWQAAWAAWAARAAAWAAAEVAAAAVWAARAAAWAARATVDFPVFTSALVKILEEVYAGK